MIIDYDKMYDEFIKDLLVELQIYIQGIDADGYNILTSDYREQYFEKLLEEVNMHHGKIFLYKKDDKIVGLIVGIINNDEISTYDFKAPKRGRIIELIVNKNIRSKGIGTALLNKMEEYLNSIGCQAILLEAFGYNKNAIEFYQKNGYNTRMIDMIKHK